MMLFDDAESYIEDAIKNQEKETAKYWAICETDNCANKNIPIAVDTFVTPPIVYCGCCNAIINNLEKIND